MVKLAALLDSPYPQTGHGYFGLISRLNMCISRNPNESETCDI
jgi:hypothetical protein